MIVLDLQFLYLLVLGLLALASAVSAWFAYRRAKHNFQSKFDEKRIGDNARQSQFIGMLSHEMRTPLTTMLGHIELLRHPDSSSKMRSDSLDTIHAQVGKLTRLIQDLSFLNRLHMPGAQEKTDTDLVLPVEAAIGQQLPAAEKKNIRIELDVQKPLPLVNASTGQMEQVLVNLLDNAIKYGLPGDYIKVLLKKEGNGIACKVVDNGPGIPQEHLNKVTKQLYRVRKDVPGSGLGLAIVDEILKLHNSKLELESSTVPEKSGTCARFYIG